MEPAGWTIMILSITSVLTMVGYCLFKVLTLPPVEVEDLHAPQTIDTGDTQQPD